MVVLPLFVKTPAIPVALAQGQPIKFLHAIPACLAPSTIRWDRYGDEMFARAE